MPENKKIIDELSKAYKTEIAGYDFYNKAAAIVGDEKGKNVFSHLAKEELDHIRAISRICESVKKGLGWISYEEALKGGGSWSAQGLSIFQSENELVQRLKTNQTDLNAVTIAIENEEKAVEFYSGLLKAAGKPAEKIVLTTLLEMEKGHLKILRWESESILKTGFWCGDMEYSVEKEAE